MEQQNSWVGEQLSKWREVFTSKRVHSSQNLWCANLNKAEAWIKVTLGEKFGVQGDYLFTTEVLR